MVGLRQLVDVFEDQHETREARNGARDEGDEIPLLDAAVLHALLGKLLVLWIALELAAVAGLGDWVVLDVGLV